MAVTRIVRATMLNRPRVSAGSAAVGLVAAAGSILIFATVASAHVEIKPDAVKGGDFAEVAFSVPNERDDASTTKLVVVLPADQPLASVETTPITGWKITTKERKLAKPIELEGAPISKVVSRITWKATGGGISPGQFQDFSVSLGVLPTSGELIFKAVQTYSDGDVVNWNEVAAGGAEPEHPAPTLTLTPPADPGGETTAPPTNEATTMRPSSTAAASENGGEDDSSDWLPITLSTAALVVALAALGLSWRRSRS